jgi:hypothetical protein
MPRDAHSVAKAVDLLDLLIEFFDDGERWIKGKIDDGAGNRCLVGALHYIRDGHNLYGAPNPTLSAEGDAAIPEDRMDWADFVQRPVQGLRRTARGDLASPQAGGRGY